MSLTRSFLVELGLGNMIRESLGDNLDLLGKDPDAGED